ncbi:MAG: radical SAM protein, partial [Arcobacter sp.]|nr:radical SAM protein [Arcobacter sp.]
MIKEVESKTIIHKHKKAFPVLQDVNIYRGCTIGCKYCFAQYSHYYLGLDNFFKDIIVKTNSAECLERELYKKRNSKEQIKIGGITDSYQHIEKKYLLMPKLLKVLKKYKIPIFLSTKSDLILRDLDLIKELAKVISVDVAVSISGIDEETAKIIEPGAPSPHKRIETLGQFTSFCRSTSLLNMPILPFLSDSIVELDKIFELTQKNNIDNLVTYPLHLRNKKVKNEFLNLIEIHFPEKVKRMVDLFDSSGNNEYYKELNRKIFSLRKKYDMFDEYLP